MVCVMPRHTRDILLGYKAGDSHDVVCYDPHPPAVTSLHTSGMSFRFNSSSGKSLLTVVLQELFMCHFLQLLIAMSLWHSQIGLGDRRQSLDMRYVMMVFAPDFWYVRPIKSKMFLKCYSFTKLILWYVKLCLCLWCGMWSYVYVYGVVKLFDVYGVVWWSYSMSISMVWWSYVYVYGVVKLCLWCGEAMSMVWCGVVKLCLW